MTRAFGLELDASFPVPGLDSEPSTPAAPSTVLELASPEELRSLWREASPDRISDRRLPDGRQAMSIDADPEHGYLMYAFEYGSFWVAADGTQIRCAPAPDVPPWQWQRYLIGQVLPFASVLRGFEVFHASAVEIAGRALVFLGPVGSGKTTLALSLVSRGAGLLADDVVAVDATASELRVEPGAGACNVRNDMAAFLSPARGRQLGEVLGADPESVRIAVPRSTAPLTPAAIYVLERGRGDFPAIEPLVPLDPRLLLAGTFNLVIRTPERLARQLDLCARLAGQVPSYRVVIPKGFDPLALASSIERHAAEL